MCAYKPPRVSNESLNGQAQVLFNPKVPGKLRVKLMLKNGQGEVEETLYEVLKENAPAYLHKSGTYRVRMSQDGKKIFSAVPSDGTLTCVYLGISHKEGELPTPKLQTGGKYEDYLQFIMNFKVVGEEFKDLEIPVFLRYNFQPADDGGKQVVAYSHFSEKKPSKYTILLDKILTGIGVWDKGPMAWKDNILPVIHKRALAKAEEGVQVVLSLQDGYVTNCRPTISDDEWGEESEAETKAVTDAASSVQTSGVITEPDPDEEDVEVTPASSTESSDDEIDWNS